jgi:hypothetical protein
MNIERVSANKLRSEYGKLGFFHANVPHSRPRNQDEQRACVTEVTSGIATSIPPAVLMLSQQ